MYSFNCGNSYSRLEGIWESPEDQDWFTELKSKLTTGCLGNEYQIPAKISKPGLCLTCGAGQQTADRPPPATLSVVPPLNNEQTTIQLMKTMEGIEKILGTRNALYVILLSESEILPYCTCITELRLTYLACRRTFFQANTGLGRQEWDKDPTKSNLLYTVYCYIPNKKMLIYIVWNMTYKSHFMRHCFLYEGWGFTWSEWVNKNGPPHRLDAGDGPQSGHSRQGHKHMAEVVQLKTPAEVGP